MFSNKATLSILSAFVCQQKLSENISPRLFYFLAFISIENMQLYIVVLFQSVCQTFDFIDKTASKVKIICAYDYCYICYLL